MYYFTIGRTASGCNFKKKGRNIATDVPPVKNSARQIR